MCKPIHISHGMYGMVYIHIYHMPHAHDNVNMYGKPCGKTIYHIPH